MGIFQWIRQLCTDSFYFFLAIDLLLVVEVCLMEMENRAYLEKFAVFKWNTFYVELLINPL